MIQKWEYKIAVPPDWSNTPDVLAWLNQLGQEGWEMVGLDGGNRILNGHHYFKRPILEQSNKPKCGQPTGCGKIPGTHRLGCNGP